MDHAETSHLHTYTHTHFEAAHTHTHHFRRGEGWIKSWTHLDSADRRHSTAAEPRQALVVQIQLLYLGYLKSYFIPSVWLLVQNLCTCSRTPREYFVASESPHVSVKVAGEMK